MADLFLLFHLDVGFFILVNLQQLVSLLLGRLLVGIVSCRQNHFQSSGRLLHQRLSDYFLGIEYSFLGFLGSPLFLFFLSLLLSLFHSLQAGFLFLKSLLVGCLLPFKLFLACLMSGFDCFHLFFDCILLSLLLLFAFLLPLKFLLLLLFSGDSDSLLHFLLLGESSCFGLFLCFLLGGNLFLGRFHTFNHLEFVVGDLLSSFNL